MKVMTTACRLSVARKVCVPSTIFRCSFEISPKRLCAPLTIVSLWLPNLAHRHSLYQSL